MTAINISSDIATSFTTVSDIFIDQYMPKANGEFVKVYLYLLRATGSGAGIATISEIADHFSNTEADIIRALNYWASEGILQVQTGSAHGSPPSHKAFARGFASLASFNTTTGTTPSFSMLSDIFIVIPP